MKDSFYSTAELSKLGFANFGSGCKISRFARFYGVSNVSIGDFVRIDDFVVISVQAPSNIGDYVHIGTMSLISSSLGFDFGQYSTFSSRVSAYGQNDDYSGNSLTNPMVEASLREVEQNRLVVGEHVIVGAGTVILPHGSLAEGVAVGALSLVKNPTEPWGIYAGIPAKRIKNRSRKLKELPKEDTVNND
jgi:acetyltransferase-like isoleucine patch superfamily enzyme